MERLFYYNLLALLLIFGCSPIAREETTATKAIEEPRKAEPMNITPPPKSELLGSDRATVKPAPNLVPNKDDIKMLQARLKAAGFYVGPIDGIAGPKTRSAVDRLRAACANLKDMLGPSNQELFPSTTTLQTGRVDDPTVGNQKTSDVRLVQVRLKDAGFDPGPIDGVMGAKTKAALFRFQAGCTMLKNAPPVLTKEAQSVERKISPITTSNSRSGLDVSAIAGQTDVDKERVSRKQSSSIEEIRQEQIRLKSAGFDPGPIDGLLGPKTEAARRLYEKSRASKKPNY